MLELEYFNSWGYSQGTRRIPSDGPLLDPIFWKSDWYGTYKGEPAFAHILDVCLYVISDDGTYFSGNINLRADAKASYFQKSLWAELLVHYEADLLASLGLQLYERSEDEPTKMAAGEGHIEDVGDDYASVDVKMPIADRVEDLESKLRSADQLLQKIWSEVCDLSDGVESSSPPPPPRPRSVFISHSSRDKKFARRLHQRLEDEGIDSWLDEEQILAGHDLVKQLEEGLRDSDFVVAVLSDNYLNGPWAQEEYRSALSRQIDDGNVVLLPARIEECRVPDFLRAKLYADFSRDFRIGIKALLKAIKEHELTGSA